ncbi:MAG: hypothetical protein IJT94_16820, partial [Oscillibacter sp.]|nr:hypothetical protein [Oscillibacter sp.]
MKRFLSLLCAAAFVLSLTACSRSGGTASGMDAQSSSLDDQTEQAGSADSHTPPADGETQDGTAPDSVPPSPPDGGSPDGAPPSPPDGAGGGPGGGGPDAFGGERTVNQGTAAHTL